MNAAKPAAPAISIVTISFNQAPYVEECIRSVLGQNCGDAEYIIVDPGSMDGSRDIIRRYESAITAFIEEPDAGPADGLNKGFARARAEICGYINSDDRFVPGALRFVLDYFRRHLDVDVLTGAIGIMDERGVVSLRKRTSDYFDLADYAAGVCTIGQQATFFRRRAFEKAGGFNVQNRIAWDGELLVDMALTGARFATVRKVLGDFRIYGGSITGSSDYRNRLSEHHDAIVEKLARSGVPLYSPLEEKIRRFFYKTNIARHLNYLLVT